MKKALSMPAAKSKLMASSLLAGMRTSYVLGENGNLERIIRKRKRKNTDQLKTLMREFERNPNWCKDTLLEVSRKTGLSEAQVYKWGWDQKRKKYGPELAALMMPGFEEYEAAIANEGGEAFHLQMLKEAREEEEEDSEEEEEKEKAEQHTLSMKARLYGNPTPFPNEALLEKLSNKLA